MTVAGDAVADPRPAKVLLVASDLGAGGSERQMLALARRLPRDRFAPTLAVVTEGGLHAAEAEAHGIAVHVLGVAPPSRAGRARFAVTAARAAWRYVRLARRERFDLVDAWLYHAYWLAALTAPLAGIGVLVSGRRSLSDFKDRWGRVARWIDAVARRRSAVLVANADIVRADVITREAADPQAIVVIRNGVTIPPPPPADSRATIRARWGADGMVVGCVSNLKPGKGIEHLLRAFAALPPATGERRLVLVGDGPLRAPLGELAGSLGIAEAVRFHGLDPEPTALLAGFDVFAHPSDTEGLPNAVLEAAAAGLPIVATDAGGTSEIVVAERTGLLVGVGDVAGLRDALARLLGDADLRARLGAAARRHAGARYGMDRFVAETAALYERLLVRR